MPTNVEHPPGGPISPRQEGRNHPPHVARVEFAWRFSQGVWVILTVLGPLFASLTIQVLNLAYTLNDAVNRGKHSASSDSTQLLTVALMLMSVLGLVFQDFWGQAGSWWGRQRIITTMSAFVLLGAVFFLVATLVEAPAFLLVASSFVGLTAGLIWQAAAYSADISLGWRLTSNIGKVKGATVGGAAVGMLVHMLADDSVMKFTAAVALAAGGVISASCCLPDWSPLVEKRVSPTKQQVIWSFVPCCVYYHVRTITAHTKLLLAYHFFAAASFHSTAIWLFNYAIERFDFDVLSCDTFIFGSCISVVVAVAAGTLIFTANKGADIVVWSTPVFSAIASFGRSTPITLWASLPFVGLKGLGATLVEALYFGQAHETERGEMAAILSITASFGTVFGVAMCGPLSVAWMSNFERTGNSGLHAGVPSPPLLQLLFDVIGSVCYYTARLQFGDQDRFGTCAVVVEESTSQRTDPDAGVPSS